MKNPVLFGLMAVLAGTVSAASVTITGATAHDPWDGKVDVAYTVADREGEDCDYQVKFAFGGVTAMSFAEWAWCDLPVANGSHTVTWDARADGVETPVLTSPTAEIVNETVTAAAADYMIIDVSSGKDSTAYPVRYAKAAAGVTTAQFNKPAYKLDRIAFKKVKVGDFLTTDAGAPYTFKMGEGTVATGSKWHPVRLTKDYFLGIFEVTQRQYEDVTGANPSAWKAKETALESIQAEITDYTMHPVGQVYYDLLAAEGTGIFPRLTARAQKGGVAVGSIGAPTEAQWEYACRAGCENKYHWGADTETAEGELVEDRYGWNNLNGNPNAGTGRTTHGVGELLPNAWGFYDMTGNIYEYCSDFHGNYASTSSSVPEENPTGAASGANRVIRGGASSFQRIEMASGYRRAQSTSSAGSGYGGFWAPMMGGRLAMTVEAE